MTDQTTPAQNPSVPLLTADALLRHWQGHRRITRRTIEAFPADKLFDYSIGGMRTFAEMVSEMLGMGLPTVQGILSGKWDSFTGVKAETKDELLRLWDEQTAGIEQEFPNLTPAQFGALHKAFGQWEFSGLTLLQYVIDNEIHHRGEGYVYLRSLGIEPPPFWDRY